MAASCGISAMYTILVFYLPDHEYNVLESAIYSSLHRLGWCLAIGWIVLACVTGNAGNQFEIWYVLIHKEQKN